jgi:hypothetical protein
MKKLILLSILLSGVVALGDDYLPRNAKSTAPHIEGVRGGYTSVVEEGYDPQPGDVPYIIENPTVRDSDMFFFRHSNGQALCNYLGYQKYVRNSAKHSKAKTGSGVLVDKTEYFSFYVNLDLSGFDVSKVSQITCLNVASERSQPIITKFKNPVYPGTEIPLSTGSDPSGACNLLGYGSHIYNGLYAKHRLNKELNFEIGRQGNIIRQRESNTIAELVCIKR